MIATRARSAVWSVQETPTVAEKGQRLMPTSDIRWIFASGQSEMVSAYLRRLHIRVVLALSDLHILAHYSARPKVKEPGKTHYKKKHSTAQD
mmetsp:Transcript_26473/g.69593  ORF Transcript_26473/g.69593 Transcript_26473/m.69593 type:complete len:92 (+) Transcript_26473:349-624(+)